MDSEEIDALKEELKEMKNQYEAVKGMTEEQACIAWNVDSKADMVEFFEEEIQRMEERIENEDLDDDIWNANGFRDEADYNMWRYGTESFKW